jgi:ABC-2 type transport system permease protein
MSSGTATDLLGAGRAPARPLWWLLLRRELADLWLGGRLLILLILFAVLMSVTAVMRELESAVNIIPPAEMVFLTLQSCIAFGMIVSLIIGADTVSGERERGTLEPLLLAPASRREIIFGKYLAAISPWPVVLLLTVPYLLVVSDADGRLAVAFLWAALVGTLLALAYTGFAMIVSMWSRSNRTSLFVSLFTFLIFLIPTQFPGEAQKGGLGYAVQQVNPMQATSSFLEKIIVNNRSFDEIAAYFGAQVIAATVIVILLFGYAAPRLRLEGGSPRLGRPRRRTSRVSLAAVIGGLLVLGAVVGPQPGARATVGGPASAGRSIPAAAVEPPFEIAIDMETAVVNTGDEIEFATEVTNTGSEVSPNAVVAMNIINLGKGDPVDPEDWSPERTQEVDPLEPGESIELDWSVEAILDGDYMVYMTVIANPGAEDVTSVPIASPGIHLTVRPFQSTNPAGVLPVAIGVPLLLIAIALFVRWYRRRDRTAPQAPEPTG